MTSLRLIPQVSDLKQIFVGRETEKQLFEKLLRGELADKWILNLYGNAGAGKTLLLDQFRVISAAYPSASIDFHYLGHRKYSGILASLAQQLEINDPGLEELIKQVANAKKEEELAPSLRQATNRFCQVCQIRVEQTGRPIILFFDTFDDLLSVHDITQWFVPELLGGLKGIVRVVITGQSNVHDQVSLPDELQAAIEFHQLLALAEDDVLDFFDKSGLGQLESDEKDRIIEISGLEPLLVAWLADLYLRSLITRQELLNLPTNRPMLLKQLAERLVNNIPDRSIAKAIVLAAHCYPRFDIDVYRAIVSEDELSQHGHTHQEVIDELKGYFFVRARDGSRLLHDTPRDALFEWIRGTQTRLEEYRVYSQRVVKNLYNPRITELENINLRSYDEQFELDILQAQRQYHLLFIDPARQYLPLWHSLDTHWHEFRLDQMALLLDLSKVVDERLPAVNKDQVLPAIISSARAWMLILQSNYEAAEQEARKVYSSRGRVPRRLLATAINVLGRTATARGEFEEALSYLDHAGSLYRDIMHEKRTGTFSISEFSDDLDDLYLEQFNVLEAIGRLRRTEFLNLTLAEDAFKDYLKLADEPRYRAYRADALRNLASVKRFRHEINDGLDLAYAALHLYREEPEAMQAGEIWETIGALFKEDTNYEEAQDAFEQAIRIFQMHGSYGEPFLARALRGMGHTLALQFRYNEAQTYYEKAERLFLRRAAPESIGDLDLKVKQGELARAQGLTGIARDIFRESSRVAKRVKSEFWYYHAELNLLEMDWRVDPSGAEGKLKQLLDEHIKAGYEFAPLYSRTEVLRSEIFATQGHKTDMYYHLVAALAHLATHWHAQYQRVLALLRKKLASEPPVDRVSITNQIVAEWIKQGLYAQAPSLINMCRIVGQSAI